MIFKEFNRLDEIITKISNSDNDLDKILEIVKGLSDIEANTLMEKAEVSSDIIEKINTLRSGMEEVASVREELTDIIDLQALSEEGQLQAQLLSIGTDEAEVVSTNAVTTAQSANITIVDVMKLKYKELAASIGVSTAALTTFIAVAAGVAIAAVVIEKVHVSAKETKEAVSELMDEFDSTIKTAKDNEKTVESLADRYEELSQGVNNLGKNVSLTNEEYDEYNDIVNKIADMFPTLVQGYTDEGNAILNLKGNVEQLRDAYKEAQQEAYNLLIADGKDSDGNDIINQWVNLSEDTFLERDVFGSKAFNQKAKRDVANFIANSDGNLETVLDELTKYVNEYGYASNEIYDFVNNEIGLRIGNYNGSEFSDTINGKKLNSDIVSEIRQQARVISQTYQSEINLALKDMHTLANAYLMTNDDYSKLTEESKSVASIIINTFTEEMANGFNKKEDVGAYVDNIVTILAGTSEKEGAEKAQRAMLDLFSLDIENMPINDAKVFIDEYISTIAEILGIDENELKIQLGFEDIDSLYNNYNNITTTYAKKFAPYSDFDFTHETDAYKKYQSTYEHLDEFAKNNSINTQDEIAFWEQCLDESKTRESAMRKYLLESPSITKVGNIEHLSNIQSMESDLDKIGAIYKDVKDMETFDYSSILNNEEFSAIFSGYTEEYQKFIETISNSPDDINACQSSFDDLVSAYINGKGFIEDVTDETKASTVAMLEQMGVTNANEIVTRALTISKERLRLESSACKDATLDEILAMYDAADAGTITKMVLAQLALEKKIINGTAIDTASDIEQIYNLAQSAGASAEVLEKLAWAKKVFESTGNGSYGNLYEYQKAKEFTDSLENGTYKIRFNIDDYRVDYNGEDNSSNSDKLSDYADLLEKETTLLEKQLEAGIITFKDYTDKRKSIIEDYYRQGLISAEDYYSALEDMYEYQLSLYDKVIDAVNYRIDKKIDALEKDKESIEDIYNLRIESIQTEIDELEKAREKREQQVDLEKALYEVEKARSQRNVKLYSGTDRGIIYTNDSKALREAEENLENEKYESHISKLEEQIKSLEEEMGRATDAIDEQIESLREYADDWSDVADAYEHAQNDMIATQILGANYEEEIVNQRRATLEIFKNDYIAAQNAMAEANRKVYESQVNNKQDEVVEPVKPKHYNTRYKVVVDGKTMADYGNSYTAKVWMKNNAPSGTIVPYKVPVYTKGGVIGTKKSPLDSIAQSLGEDHLVAGKEGERFLTPVQNEMWEKWTEALPNLQNFANMLQYNIPNYNFDNMIIRNNNKPTPTINIGDIHLHEVQNVPDFAKALQKHLPNISVQYNGKH